MPSFTRAYVSYPICNYQAPSAPTHPPRRCRGCRTCRPPWSQTPPHCAHPGAGLRGATTGGGHSGDGTSRAARRRPAAAAAGRPRAPPANPHAPHLDAAPPHSNTAAPSQQKSAPICFSYLASSSALSRMKAFLMSSCLDCTSRSAITRRRTWRATRFCRRAGLASGWSAAACGRAPRAGRPTPPLGAAPGARCTAARTCGSRLRCYAGARLQAALLRGRAAPGCALPAAGQLWERAAALRLMHPRCRSAPAPAGPASSPRPQTPRPPHPPARRARRAPAKGRTRACVCM